MTVECPLTCEYLQQAHEFERVERAEAPLAHSEIEISPDFLEEAEELLGLLGSAIFAVALETPGALDADVREALAALVETYITLEKGVLYEHTPANQLAADMFHSLQELIAEIKEGEIEETRQPVRTRDLLHALVFLLRLAADRDNGRKRGRAFIELLHRFHAPDTAALTDSRLILP